MPCARNSPAGPPSLARKNGHSLATGSRNGSRARGSGAASAGDVACRLNHWQEPGRVPIGPAGVRGERMKFRREPRNPGRPKPARMSGGLLVLVARDARVGGVVVDRLEVLRLDDV